MLRVIVLGFRSEAFLPKLLESLVKHLHAPAELVVWDNDGRTRPLMERWLASHSPGFSVVIAGNGINLGFGAAVNRAAALATGRPYTSLLLLNADTALATDLDEGIEQQLSALGGIVGLRIFDDNERQHRQASARMFPNWITAIAGREGWLTRLWPGNPWSRRYLGTDLSFETLQRVDWVSGCGMLCTRAAWEKLGGFDERYFMYAEDVDLARRARDGSVPVYYSPTVDVVHAVRGSTGRRSFKADLYHHRSMWLYYWKWSSFGARFFAPFIAVGILLRLLVRRIA